MAPCARTHRAVMPENSFDARGDLEVGGRTLRDLPAGCAPGEVRRRAAAVLAEDPAREPAAQRGRRRRAHARTSRRWRAGTTRPSPQGDRVHARARGDAGLHRRARRGRPRRACATRWPTSAATPTKINPLVPAELVIDHSVQVDVFGTRDAFRINAEREFERNEERYGFLRWGQSAFEGFKVVPPDTGIVHQVNLEYLARVVFEQRGDAVPGHAGRDRLAHDDDQRRSACSAGASAASRPRRRCSARRCRC